MAYRGSVSSVIWMKRYSIYGWTIYITTRRYPLTFVSYMYALRHWWCRLDEQRNQWCEKSWKNQITGSEVSIILVGNSSRKMNLEFFKSFPKVFSDLFRQFEKIFLISANFGMSKTKLENLWRFFLFYFTRIFFRNNLYGI